MSAVFTFILKAIITALCISGGLTFLCATAYSILAESMPFDPKSHIKTVVTIWLAVMVINALIMVYHST